MIKGIYFFIILYPIEHFSMTIQSYVNLNTKALPRFSFYNPEEKVTGIVTI